MGRPWRSWSSSVALLLLVLLARPNGTLQALSKELANELQSIWEDNRSLSDQDVEQLRRDAWNMFDEGFTNYMSLAFPKDNLLPISCTGADWQGGMAVTLLDSLDSLMMMGRLSDMRSALSLIKRHVDFTRPLKVHVFEVVIRVVGGLLSGHSLLARARDLVPEYDDSLLHLATQLAEAMLPAFGTPSGLPRQFTNLKTGPVTDNNVTCTACAGTLLLEYGTLSALHGHPRWLQLADHAVHSLYSRRSSLGLVGSSLDVGSSTWVSRDATIGPGTDSFYEYLLKSYLMFGNRTHLDMFGELYVAAMRHLQVPGTLRGYSFLADVHMDSGRVSRPFVSSLGAFWPGMQALAGQRHDAVDLHANFTAAWQTWGWMPELFGLDLTRVHPEDPGYNLRPEHVESTFMLHALTGKPIYRKIAARMQRTLRSANRAPCGYAAVSNVETGEKQDLQESFFLSETVKYLYLSFTQAAPHLLDYYVLTTEGHLLPAFLPEDAQQEDNEQAELQAVVQAGVPTNCVELCKPLDPDEQVVIERDLRRSFPLLVFRREEAITIKRRRCIACVHVTKQMASNPPSSISARTRIMHLSAELHNQGMPASNKPLSQVVCVIRVARNGAVSCQVLRPLMAHDMAHGLPHNAVVLQLSWVEGPTQRGLLLVSPLTTQDEASLVLQASTASFGSPLVEITLPCFRHLFNVTQPWLLRPSPAATEPQASHQPGGSPPHQDYMGRNAALTLQQLSVPVSALALQVIAAQRSTAACVLPVQAPADAAATPVDADTASAFPDRAVELAGSSRGGLQPDAEQLADGLQTRERQQQHQQEEQEHHHRQGEHHQYHHHQEHQQHQQQSHDHQQEEQEQQHQHQQHHQHQHQHHQGQQCSSVGALDDSEVMGPTVEELEGEVLWNGLEPDDNLLSSGELPPSSHPQPLSPESASSSDRCEALLSYVNDSEGVNTALPVHPPGAPSSQHPAFCQALSEQHGRNAGAHHAAAAAGAQQAPGLTAPGVGSLRAAADMTHGHPHEQQDGGWLAADPSPPPSAGQSPAAVEEPGLLMPGHPAGSAAAPAPAAAAAWTFEDPHLNGPCKHVPVVYGELVMANPPHACNASELLEAGNLSGMVAVVQRGGCSFSRKAQAVQEAGALAMVVVNQDHGQELVTMTSDVPLISSAVRIPSLLLSGHDSRLLLHAILDAACVHRPSPVATLALDHPQLRAVGGMSDENRATGVHRDPGPEAEAGAPRSPPAHDGVAPSKSGSTRVDLLVPTTSHAFIKANVVARGYDLQAIMEGLLEDERVTLMLMQVAKENEAVSQRT